MRTVSAYVAGLLIVSAICFLGWPVSSDVAAVGGDLELAARPHQPTRTWQPTQTPAPGGPSWSQDWDRPHRPPHRPEPTGTPAPGGCGQRFIEFSIWGAGDLCFETGTVRACGEGTQSSPPLSACGNAGGAGQWYDVGLYRFHPDGSRENPPYSLTCWVDYRQNSNWPGDHNQFETAPGQFVSQRFVNYGSEGAKFACSVNGGASGQPTPAPASPPAPQAIAWGPGQFYPQTNYWVRDGVQMAGVTANFMSEYQRFGGPNTLGYPISRPFWSDNVVYQAFQNGILQWRPEYADAVITNVVDWFYMAGYDSYLTDRGVPAYMVNDGCPQGDTACSMKNRALWLTDGAIKAVYLGKHQATYFGFPTSYPQPYGGGTVQRFQKSIFLNNGGTVLSWPVGDVAKQANFLPASSLIPEAP
jgi:hypothetical protein